MDQEFQRALIVVLIVGTFIATVGGIALYFIFRRFGDAKAGGTSHMLLIGGLLAFVLCACAALFVLSYSRW
jgi:hypothetical protein